MPRIVGGSTRAIRRARAPPRSSGRGAADGDEEGAAHFG
ncbi:hypothetical protein C7S16_4162 [Burkholderia thailandensis]|uniref:Uncharacterized protein n=1 Tax=Burkholderia thailandensis TaxID=57975 RepID=A0AAW9CQD1_BURTH|nr:hypothetical protein [Burkholderia thailandensis]MDW9251821.1 hypothetical protein [Burkholderia thailandensis]